MAVINRQLNLVIPIIREDETTVYIHSTPIRAETFEFYHMVLAKTWSGFIQNGLDPRSAPSVAALVLKETSKATPRIGGVSWWDGNDGVGGDAGLLAEVIRLSNAIVPSKDNGWSSIPLQMAIDQNLITSEEKSEVMNLVSFFTVASSMPPRVDREKIVRGMAAMYELLTTYSNSTEFANSLKMSTQDDTSGKNDPA
jgi:hypothetical protein